MTHRPAPSRIHSINPKEIPFMNAKTVVTVFLLVFVAASVIGMVLNERASEPMAPEPMLAPEMAPLAATAGPTFPQDGVAALYFHGDTRCPTCRKIEATAEEAIVTNYANEMKRGTVTWQDVNYETPSNRHYLDDFDLVAPTLVLVKTNNGQQVAWRNMDQVWELVGDRTALSDYVEDGINSYLTEGTSE
jgi:hypothetical protein